MGAIKARGGNMEKRQAGTEIIKDALFKQIYTGQTSTGRESVTIEFIKDGDIIRQVFLIDNIMGLKECCDFIRSIPIPETKLTHIYKNQKQFRQLISTIYHLYKKSLGGGKMTRDDTPHGYDTYDLEVTTTSSGWTKIKFLNVI